MSMDKLHQAKERFETAAKHAGDAAHTSNVMADGLSKLTEALIEIRKDIDAIKRATSKRSSD